MKQFEKLTTESGKLKLESAAARWLRVFLLLSAFSFQLSAFQPAFSQYVPRYDGGGGGGGGVVDGQQLFDDSHVLSLDADNRRLYASDGVTLMLSWNGSGGVATWMSAGALPLSTGSESKFAYTDLAGAGFEGAAGLSVDVLVNAWDDSLLNIDLIHRKLYASDGTTAMLDWSDPDQFRFFHNTGVFWDSGTSTTHMELDALLADNLKNYNGDGNPNIDLLNRKLFNPDGTTVAIDYGTNFTVNLGPSGEGSIYNDPTGGTGGGAYKDIIFQILTGMVDIEYDSGDSASNKFEIYSFLGVPLELYGDGGVDIQAPSGQFVTIHDNIKVPSLPTSDPFVFGQLWNNAGTLKVSAGP